MSFLFFFFGFWFCFFKVSKRQGEKKSGPVRACQSQETSIQSVPLASIGDGEGVALTVSSDWTLSTLRFLVFGRMEATPKCETNNYRFRQVGSVTTPAYSVDATL